jgi:hypothetical protein
MKIASRKWLVVVGLLLVAGIAAAIVYWPQPKKDSEPPPVANLPPIKFVDVTDAAGIQFHHVSGSTPKKLLPETMGSGVAVIDFDRDGWPDLFFVNSRTWPGQPAAGRSQTPALYRNRGNGTFEDVTKSAGLDVEIYGMGVAVGDYDNDTWPDLFVTAVGGNRLFHNLKGKTFDDVTLAAGLGQPMAWPKGSFEEFLTHAGPISFPSSSAFLDYDGDGSLDLFVCNYLTWSPAADLGAAAVLPGGNRAYVPPQQFAGAQCALFRNSGGRFEDVSASAGVHVSEPGVGNSGPRAVGKALGVIVCDPDHDGWPDLVVANDTVRNFFFHNVADGKGGRTFKEDGQIAGLAYADGRPRGGMGIDSGEVTPGEYAIVIVNFSNEPNSLFRRNAADPLRFTDTAPDVGLAGMSRYPMKFGATFFDCDRDGLLDLFVANGHLEPDIAAAQEGQTYRQRAQLFWNSRAVRALLVPTEAEMFPAMVGRGSAYLDYDGDGDIDLVVTDNNGRARLFRNDTETNNRAIRLVLSGAGKTNRDAIGAAVDVEVGGVVRRWYVSPTRGYLSQSELTTMIGVGAATKIERVAVRWPGAGERVQEWTNLEAGKTYSLVEGMAEAKVVPPPAKP